MTDFTPIDLPVTSAGRTLRRCWFSPTEGVRPGGAGAVYVDNNQLSGERAIAAIRAAGGIASLEQILERLPARVPIRRRGKRRPQITCVPS